MGRITKATAANGFIKMSVISARDAVETARAIHSCSPTAAAALGRTLCAASMLGEAMKEEHASLTVRINGSGPIGSIVAVSDCDGFVRGYVDEPNIDLPLRGDGKLDVGGAVGRDGLLTVSRDLGLKEPYIGSTALVSGEIAEDFTAYLLESEQVPSACGLGVLVDTDLSIKAAGGFIVQLMPGADEGLIDILEDNILMMDSLTTILAEDGDEAVLSQVLKGLEYHIIAHCDVGYRCSCTRERVENALMSIGRESLSVLTADDKNVEVRCQFCNTSYSFSPLELQTLFPAPDM